MVVVADLGLGKSWSTYIRSAGVVALGGLILSAVFAVSPQRAGAWETVDGRVQVHGFYEMQLRTLSKNLSEEYDLSQWYHILNVEIEADLLPDGLGFIDRASAYARLEVRYDCIYTYGCGLFPSANAYVQESDRQLPSRLRDAHRSGLAGGQMVTDTNGVADLRYYHGVPRSEVENYEGFINPLPGEPLREQEIVANRLLPSGGTSPARAWQLPGIGLAFVGAGSDNLTGPTAEGPDGVRGTDDDGMSDDPADFVFAKYLDYDFALQGIPGPENGDATRIMFIDYKDINPIGDLRNTPNPWRGFWDYDYDADGDGIADGRRTGDYNPIMGRDDYDTQEYLVDENGQPEVDEDGDPVINPNGPLGSGVPGSPAQNSGCMSGAPDAGPNGGCPREFRNGTTVYTGNRLVWTSNSTHFGYATLSQGYGQAEMPFRPAARLGNEDASDDFKAQGLYYPNAGLRRVMKQQGKRLTSEIDQNFTTQDLTWNRGASQQQTKELKEIYLDFETLDGQLWTRLGKQNIVWGKTELFRTTDQFNPQDFAMTSVPDLESSRIALWAARFIYSFYEVGPLEDFRLEFAFNFDEYEPADLGRCGEPYVPDTACQIATGYLAHGFAALGLAGTTRPEDPWDDVSGLEIGARIEFRAGRFSIAITDFWGYDDFPYPNRIFTYARYVDHDTGRPLSAVGTGPCDPDNGQIDGCLGYVSAVQDERFSDFRIDHMNQTWDPNKPWESAPYEDSPEAEEAYSERKDDVLAHAVVNQQLFAMGCAITYGTLRNMPKAYGMDWDCGAGALQTTHLSTISGDFSWDSQIASSGLIAAGNPFRLKSMQGSGLSLFTRHNFPLYQSNLLDRNYTTYLSPRTSDPDTKYDPEDGAMAFVPLNQHDNQRSPCDENNGNRETVNRQGRVRGFLDAGTASAQQANCASQSLPELELRIGGLDDSLSDAQLALIGCGPFYGEYFHAYNRGEFDGSGAQTQTQAFNSADGCDLWGVDLLNAEASVLLQSWNIVEGAPMTTLEGIQPGTVAFQGGPVGTRYDQALDAMITLPGARSKYFWDGQVHNDWAQRLMSNPNYTYTDGAEGLGFYTKDTNNDLALDQPLDPNQVLDPNILTQVEGGSNVFRTYVPRMMADAEGRVVDGQGNPVMITDAAGNATYAYLNENWERGVDGDPVWDWTDLSRNIDADACPSRGGSGELGNQCAGDPLNHPWVAAEGGSDQYFKSEMAALSFNFQVLTVSTSRDFLAGEPFRLDGCSLAVPRLCKNVRDFASGTVATRSTLRAGGNNTYGRRDFVWQAGSPAVLDYNKRNVLGFSTDFAEDWSKTNWSTEMTWVSKSPAMDQNSFSGLTDVNRFNLTVSVDRPTFINFLNPGRTFFINSQWFFSYADGYEDSFLENGPLNVLFTVTAFTGYFQDRLQPMITSVYDFASNSGAVLPSISYRFNDRLSAEFGINWFYGRWQAKDGSINPLGPANRVGQYKDNDFQENGLAAISDHDEVFFRFRYTF